MMNISELPKYPKNETLWETMLLNNVYYIITSKPDRSKYYLYELSDGKWKKKAVGNTPVELLKKIG